MPHAEPAPSPSRAIRHFSGQCSVAGELIRWENQHLPCPSVQTQGRGWEVCILPATGPIRIPSPEAASTHCQRCPDAADAWHQTRW